MDLEAPGMRVLHAPRLATATAAAHTAAAAVAERHRVAVVEVAPASRWRVADADALCRNPRLVADAAVSIAVGLDDATSAVWDRLLKVVEEPPLPWWLFVAVRDPSALPATLRARAVSVNEAAAGDPAAELVGAGWDRADAERLSVMLGDATHLAPAAEHAEAALEAVAALNASLDATDPGAAVAAVEALCAIDGAPARPEVLRFCVQRWRSTLAAAARRAALSGDLGRFRRCAEGLQRADVADDAISRNVNPLTVLWVLWDAAGAVGPTR